MALLWMLALVCAVLAANSPQTSAGGGGAAGGPPSEPPSADADGSFFHSDQHKLFKHLFEDYIKDIRPVHSHGDIIHINFEVALFNLLELDSKTGLMTVNAEVIVRWHDPFLMWDPANYNDTHTLRIPHYHIWEPDIILYNSAAKDYKSSIITTNAIIVYTGEVKLLNQAIFVTTCSVDIQWYPFDQQTCDLIFGSLSGDIQQYVLEPGKSDISRYHPNQEFVLENFYSDLMEAMDPCCDHPFAMVSYHIQLQRRVKFAMFFFIVPGILINICAVMVFSLPAESGEKVGLGINAMLAMMVFLMAMIENLPPSENIPLAGLYYGVCLGVLTANIVFSVYVLNLSVGGQRGHRLPRPVKVVCKVMVRVLRMSVPPIVQNLWEREEREKEAMESNRVAPLHSKADSAWITAVQPALAPPDSKRFKPSPGSPENRSLAALEEIVRLLSVNSDADIKIKKERQIENVEEWKMASRVLDRFLFIIFTLVTVLFNIILLNQSPFRISVVYCDEEGNCHSGAEIAH